MNSVILKQGKEVPLLRRHPWIFSGAVQTLPSFEDGEILPILSAQGRHLGWGMFNRKSNIIGRVVSFNQEFDRDNWVFSTLKSALHLRQQWMDEKTNAYRLVNGEGDGLPGLIVDRYDDYLVIQVHTLGMDRQRENILAALKALVNPKGIYEKSTGTSRRHEGLEDKMGWIDGKPAQRITIQENGHRFHVDLQEGQKTGFFLDQRAMRERVQQLARHKNVLNCFCYTGGFSIYAAAGGANKVTSVDISQKAIDMTEQNMLLNFGEACDWQNYAQDVFDFIKNDILDYDLIILDPPAFAKKQQDLKNACKGYRDLNKAAMFKAKPDTLLLTCSCSQPVSDDQFLQVLFEAALEAGKEVQILEKQRHGIDHPVSLFHSEGSYLKGYLLRIK